MRFVTFAPSDPSVRQTRRVGAVIAQGGVDVVVDLEAAYRAGVDPADGPAVTSLGTLESVIIAGAPAREAAERAVEVGLAQPDAYLEGLPLTTPLTKAHLLSPLSSPNSLRDFIAFEDHARAGARRRGEELNPAWRERPLYYKGNHRALDGPDAVVKRPGFTQELDLEMEVACIVGGLTEDADEETAAEAIFGFTIMNDWSARDVQRVEMAARLGPAKSKDFATSLGPVVVTADELGPQPSLSMTARVNGEVICTANLGDARWTFPEMISFVSRGEAVWPTDLYGSGTPFGGCMLDHGGPYLQPGDVVEIEVERLGLLRNTVG